MAESPRWKLEITFSVIFSFSLKKLTKEMEKTWCQKTKLQNSDILYITQKTNINSSGLFGEESFNHPTISELISYSQSWKKMTPNAHLETASTRICCTRSALNFPPKLWCSMVPPKYDTYFPVSLGEPKPPQLFGFEPILSLQSLV